MDLTSRDGDWFLDELCSMSANVSQFLEMVKIEHQVLENSCDVRKPVFWVSDQVWHKPGCAATEDG